MSYLLYLIFRCDRGCDGKFGKFENFVGTKHNPDQDTCNRKNAGRRDHATGKHVPVHEKHGLVLIFLRRNLTNLKY